MPNIKLNNIRSRNQMMSWIDRLELNAERDATASTVKEAEIIEAGNVPIDYEEYLALKVLLGLNDLLFANIIEKIVIDREKTDPELKLKDFVPVLMNDPAYHDAVQTAYNELAVSDAIGAVELDIGVSLGDFEKTIIHTNTYNTELKATGIRDKILARLNGPLKDIINTPSIPKDAMLIFAKSTIQQSASYFEQTLDEDDRIFMENKGIDASVMRKLKSLIYYDDISKAKQLAPPKIIPVLTPGVALPNPTIMVIDGKITINFEVIDPSKTAQVVGSLICPGLFSISLVITGSSINDTDVITFSSTISLSPLLQSDTSRKVVLHAKTRIYSATEIDSPEAVFIFNVEKINDNYVVTAVVA